ncbi:MAG TPA: hypothetical protein VGJ20_08080 [Xanthobacteraceae bacterium]|jgi:hypothetical protein
MMFLARTADAEGTGARLTPEMSRLLGTTDIAFGRAVQTHNFRRRTLSAKLLWPPLPQDWEMGAPLPERRGATLTIPHGVLQHRAVLRHTIQRGGRDLHSRGACLPRAATALAHPADELLGRHEDNATRPVERTLR